MQQKYIQQKSCFIILVDIYNQSEIGNLSKPKHFYLLSADTSEMILPPTGSDAHCSLIALQDNPKVQRSIPVMKFMSGQHFLICGTHSRRSFFKISKYPSM